MCHRRPAVGRDVPSASRRWPGCAIGVPPLVFLLFQFPVWMPFISHADTLQETEPPFAEMDTPVLSIVG